MSGHEAYRLLAEARSGPDATVAPDPTDEPTEEFTDDMPAGTTNGSTE